MPSHTPGPSRTGVAVAAALTILLTQACSTTVATWHAAAARPHGIGPVPPSLPGFTTQDPPPVVDHGPRTGHLIALTFDSNMTVAMMAKLADHEASSYANVKVLDILERQHIAATFFLTGLWVERYPEVTRRIAANPNFELANHTYSHRAYTPNCYSLAQMPRAEMAADITRAFSVIRPYGGNQTDYFRFPGLCSDAAALAAIAPAHVTVIRGDVVSGDAGATAVQPIVRTVLTRARPGSIVIMHITRDNARMTDQALPPILAGLRARGLVPVRLSQLLAGHPRPPVPLPPRSVPAATGAVAASTSLSPQRTAVVTRRRAGESVMRRLRLSR